MSGSVTGTKRILSESVKELRESAQIMDLAVDVVDHFRLQLIGHELNNTSPEGNRLELLWKADQVRHSFRPRMQIYLGQLGIQMTMSEQPIHVIGEDEDEDQWENPGVITFTLLI